MELRSGPLDMDGLSGSAERTPVGSRRSGAALLGLLVASNFVPWAELLTTWTAAEDLATRAEIVGGLGSCLLGAAAVFAAWLFGRRGQAAAPPRVLRPRRAGLRLAILAILVNLGLAAALVAGGRNPRLSAATLGGLFFAIWYFGVLPAQLAAAFFQGRASDRTSSVAAP